MVWLPAFILVSILVVEAAELPGQGIDFGVLFVAAGGHKIRCCDDCGVDVRAAPANNEISRACGFQCPVALERLDLHLRDLELERNLHVAVVAKDLMASVVSPDREDHAVFEICAGDVDRSQLCVLSFLRDLGLHFGPLQRDAVRQVVQLERFRDEALCDVQFGATRRIWNGSSDGLQDGAVVNRRTEGAQVLERVRRFQHRIVHFVQLLLDERCVHGLRAAAPGRKVQVARVVVEDGIEHAIWAFLGVNGIFEFGAVERNVKAIIAPAFDQRRNMR